MEPYALSWSDFVARLEMIGSNRDIAQHVTCSSLIEGLRWFSACSGSAGINVVYRNSLSGNAAWAGFLISFYAGLGAERSNRLL